MALAKTDMTFAFAVSEDCRCVRLSFQIKAILIEVCHSLPLLALTASLVARKKDDETKL